MTEAEELELLELEAEAAGATPAPAAKAVPSVGGGETFLNKAAEALPLGRPLVNALTALGMKALRPSAGARLTPQAAAELGMPQEAPTPGLAQEYRNARDAFAQRTAAGSEENKLAAAGGSLFGTGLSLLAPLPKVAIGGKTAGAGARILNNALTAGGYGALNGVVNGRGDLTRGEVGQALKDAAGVDALAQAAEDAKAGHYGRAALDVMGAGGIGGALTGGALGSAVEGVKASGILPKAAAALRRVGDKQAFKALGGMKPQINELGEEAARRIGSDALDTRVLTPLASRNTMLERATAALKEAGAGTSGALSELDAAGQSALTKQAAAARVNQLADELAKKPAMRNLANRFRLEAQNILETPGEGPMSLRDFEELIARPYKQTTNWGADLPLAKETLKQLPRALEGQVEKEAGALASRTGKTGGLEKYQQAKKDFGKFAAIADIAEEGVRRDTSKKAMGLYDAMAGMSAATHALASHDPIGAALKFGVGVGASKLASRFGNQFSATGARALSNALTSPELGAANPSQAAAVLSRLLGPTLSPAGQLSAKEREELQQYAEALRNGENL